MARQGRDEGRHLARSERITETTGTGSVAGPVEPGPNEAGARPAYVETRQFTDTEQPRSDRVRWGPLWAGLVAALAIFALLQLTFIATKATTLDVTGSGTHSSFTFWSAVSAVVAFLVGGLVAGSSAKWDRVDDGLLHGILFWALTIVALLVASSVAAGAITGALGDTIGRLKDIGTTIKNNPGQNTASTADARKAAASAVAFLGVSLLASIIGAVIGSKLWPRRRHHDEVVDVR